VSTRRLPRAKAQTRRFSLMARIYGAGVALVLASGMIAWGLAHVVAHRLSPHQFGHVARFVGDAIARDPDPARAVHQANLQMGAAVSVFDRGGHLLASAGDAAVTEMPTLAPDRRARHVAEGTWVVRAGDHVTVLAFRPREQPFVPLLAGLMGVLLVVGAAAALAGRWLTRPLSALREAARAITAGDLTARTHIRAHNELGDAARAFDEMAERVEGLLRSHHELLASVSHELRTPLARLRVALDLLSEENDPAVVKSEIAALGDDLEELEVLVSDLLETARIDMRRTRTEMPLRRELTTLAEIAERAKQRFSERAPGRVVALTIDDRTPRSFDPRLLRRAIENILDNAHKYSDPSTAIRVIVRHEGQSSILEIEDDGIGMAPEDQERVFAPFFRANRPEVRASSGLGLGLALSKRIVEAHGGVISVESALGHGTTVTFRL
jgi:signal transduction histidine kinase